MGPRDEFLSVDCFFGVVNLNVFYKKNPHTVLSLERWKYECDGAYHLDRVLISEGDFVKSSSNISPDQPYTISEYDFFVKKHEKGL
jgi:hypothetical protein